MPGPPDKWTAFSTKGMTTPQELADALSQAYAEGYKGRVKNIPSPIPGEQNVTWVAVSGYETK